MLANSEVGMAGNSKAACEEGRNQRRLYFQDGIHEHHTFQKSLYDPNSLSHRTALFDTHKIRPKNDNTALKRSQRTFQNIL